MYNAATTPDLQSAFGATNYSAGLSHWLQNGLAEGRRASIDFDHVYYLKSNPYVAKRHGATNYAGGLWQWLMAGMKEGQGRPLTPPEPSNRSRRRVTLGIDAR